MATFDQNVTAIKQAQYGYEVRDAMAEGLEYLNNKTIPGRCKNFEVVDDTGSQSKNSIVTITIPKFNPSNGGLQNNRVYIDTAYNESDGYYARIRSTTNHTKEKCVWCGRRFGADMTKNVSYNKDDDTVQVVLKDSRGADEIRKGEKRETVIKVGYDGIIVSVNIYSDVDLSASSGTYTEFILGDCTFFNGYSKFKTYVGTASNIKSMTFPFISASFGRVQNLGIVSSSSNFSCDGTYFRRDLQATGCLGVAAQFYIYF